MSSKRSGSFLKRLERRFAPWAIPNLTGIIVAGQVLLYFFIRLREQQGAGIDALAFWLLPGQVLSGEVWRLVTFIFNPPNINLLFVIFFWGLLYLFGNALERTWGTVRYNIFLLTGFLAMMTASFAIWSWGGDIALIIAHLDGANLTHGFFSANTFLYGSLLFAFARLFPYYVINFALILPIQIKWLAIIQAIAYGYVFLRGSWDIRLLVLGTVFNYLLFFGRDHLRQLKHRQRRRSYQAKAEAATKKVRHECRVCGLNSNDAPKTLFRYCSKCSGQCCYCPDHIQDHEHVTEDSEATV